MVAEAFGGGEVVGVDMSAEAGGDVFLVAGECEVGIAEVSGLGAVVGGEFYEDAATLEGFEVDADSGPVFPEDGVGVVLIGVPVELVGGDEIGRVALGVDGVVVFVDD